MADSFIDSRYIKLIENRLFYPEDKGLGAWTEPLPNADCTKCRAFMGSSQQHPTGPLGIQTLASQNPHTRYCTGRMQGVPQGAFSSDGQCIPS